MHCTYDIRSRYIVKNSRGTCGTEGNYFLSVSSNHGVSKAFAYDNVAFLFMLFISHVGFTLKYLQHVFFSIVQGPIALNFALHGPAWYVGQDNHGCSANLPAFL